MKVPKARKLSSGTWFIQLRLGGESIPVKARTKKDCEKKAQLIKAEYLAGKREVNEKEPEKLPTLSEMIDKYIAQRDGNLSPSTVVGYLSIKRNRFKTIMPVSGSDLTDDMLIEAYNEEAKLVCGKTLLSAWGLVRSVLRHVAKRELPKIEKKQVISNERPFLDHEQLLIFIDAIKGSEIEIPALLGLMSLRKSEILALRWSDIDFRRKNIFVRGAAVIDKDKVLVLKKETKNSESTRTVPILIDALYEALLKGKGSTGLIVPGAQNKLYKKINKVCEENGLPKIGVHGLRHTFASLAYHLEIPIRITMKIGGWKNYQTVQKIYTHIADMDIQKSVVKMSDYLNKKETEAV